MELSKPIVLEALSNVIEPEKNKDIVSLNLVGNVEFNDKQEIIIEVISPNPTMHYKKRLEEACLFQLERKFGKEVKVKIDLKNVSKEDITHRKVLPGVKNIIAVASGKGGVGKSTIAANLAAGLAKKGFKTGLVDADIYGPSMPIMFDLMFRKPEVVEENGKSLLKPIESYGVKILSIGFFTDPSQAVVWRGPMASKALNQMFKEAAWGELDYLIIDLPPGTGDIHLSLVQSVPLTGVVIVSTPQEVALEDVKKGVNMFKLPTVNVPVLGIVENMSYFTPKELPNNKYHIFGQDGVKNLAAQLGIDLLAQIPIIQGIRESGDVGRPAILQENTPLTDKMEEMVDNLVKKVIWRNENLPATKLVEMTK